MYRRIKDMRVDHDLTQVKIASRLHIDQSTYSDYEAGRISIPVEALIRLADFYGVSVDYLLERTDIREAAGKEK